MGKRRSGGLTTRPSPRSASVQKQGPAPRRAFTGYLPGEVIEHALLTGEQNESLRDYFGSAVYEWLRDLAREAQSGTAGRGSRVLIIPDILGSLLSVSKSGFVNQLWFDPVEIALGRLTSLSKPGQDRCQARGVISFAYLAMKFRLRIAGFDADFYPYDWRRGFAELGRDLAKAIHNEGRPLALVAHGAGGLVARAALIQRVHFVSKLVMLGTPNYGTFAAVQLLRGTHPVLRNLARLDQSHTANELSSKVFTAFPALYEMLPQREKFPPLNLFDPWIWPPDHPRPRSDYLAAARTAHRHLAPADHRFYLVAGVDQDTVTGVALRGTDFEYSVTAEGDGMVPLQSALLEGIAGAQTYFVGDSHGAMPGNAAVQRAVEDLLGSGRTSALPNHARPARKVMRLVREADLQEQARTERATGDYGSAWLREMLASVVAPVTNPSGKSSGSTGLANPWAGRQKRRFDLNLARGTIVGVDARVYVLSILKEVPPRGQARVLDQRMRGTLQDLADRRMISGNEGQIFAIPVGRNLLPAEVLAFVGLGSFDQFNTEVLQRVAEGLVRTLASSGVDEFATVLIGSGTGQSTSSLVENMFVGFFRALADVDPYGRFRGLTVCEPDSVRYDAIRETLYRLSATPLFEGLDVIFQELELPPPQVMPVTHRPALPEPGYLLVRGVESGAGIEVRVSLLSAGIDAATVSQIRKVRRVDADRLLDAYSVGRGSGALGAGMAESFVGDLVSHQLLRMRDRSLIVVHDQFMGRLPWESLRIDDWEPATEAGLARNWTGGELPVATYSQERRRGEDLRVLLVVDPTRDLPGAQREAERVLALGKQMPALRITLLSGEQATRAAVISELRSQAWDVLHYSGHAFLDPGIRGALWSPSPR